LFSSGHHLEPPISKFGATDDQRRQAKRNSLAELTVEARALADLKVEKAAVEGRVPHRRGRPGPGVGIWRRSSAPTTRRPRDGSCLSWHWRTGCTATGFECLDGRRQRAGRPHCLLALDVLPKDHVSDGELVVLDDAGRPLFNELLFGRRRPTYVAFDLLIDDGNDLRPLPLEQRKARLARLGERAEGWIALTNGVVGEGRHYFEPSSKLTLRA
jgi:hypothetical protein